jgi:1-acyl-sn-glycerol-3-phosphate acyltransferase
VRRHRAVYSILGWGLGWLICLIFGFRARYTKIKSPTFLFLANHTSDLDPIYEVLGTKRHLRFVASENALRGFGGAIVSYLAGPIPRRKGASADECVDAILANLRAGVNVGIHPEGNRTWDGETGYIPPRIARVAKDSGAGLVTYRLDGGYLRTPRWARFGRRGLTRGQLVNEYSAETLASMSEGEIYDAICRDLYVDAFEEQKKSPRAYPGRKRAERLELVLFVCPVCGKIGSFVSRGDGVACRECGLKTRYDEFGFFDKAVPFKNLLDWSRWQKSWLRENAPSLAAQTDEELTYDENVRLTCGVGRAKKLLAEGALCRVFGDRIELGGFVFLHSGFEKMSAFRWSTICFTFEGEYYEIFSNRGLSGQKYYGLWRIITGKDYF